MLPDIVRQPLGSHPYSVFVHAVGPHAHHAAEPACTELEVTVERVFKTGRVVFHKVLHLFLGLFIIIAFEPALGNLSEISCSFHCSIILNFVYNHAAPRHSPNEFVLCSRLAVYFKLKIFLPFITVSVTNPTNL